MTEPLGNRCERSKWFRRLKALVVKLFLCVDIWSFKLLYLLLESRREKKWMTRVAGILDYTIRKNMHHEDGLDARKWRACDGLRCFHQSLQVQVFKSRGVTELDIFHQNTFCSTSVEVREIFHGQVNCALAQIKAKTPVSGMELPVIWNPWRIWRIVLVAARWH